MSIPQISISSVDMLEVGFVVYWNSMSESISHEQNNQYEMHSDGDKNIYEYLGCKPDDDTANIKMKYRSIVNRHHPDKTKGDLQSATFFRWATASWNIINDPEHRREYDKYLATKSFGSELSVRSLAQSDWSTIKNTLSHRGKAQSGGGTSGRQARTERPHNMFWRSEAQTFIILEHDSEQWTDEFRQKVIDTYEVYAMSSSHAQHKIPEQIEYFRKMLSSLKDQFPHYKKPVSARQNTSSNSSGPGGGQVPKIFGGGSAGGGSWLFGQGTQGSPNGSSSRSSGGDTSPERPAVDPKHEFQQLIHKLNAKQYPTFNESTLTRREVVAPDGRKLQYAQIPEQHVRSTILHNLAYKFASMFTSNRQEAGNQESIVDMRAHNIVNVYSFGKDLPRFLVGIDYVDTNDRSLSQKNIEHYTKSNELERFARYSLLDPVTGLSLHGTPFRRFTKIKTKISGKPVRCLVGYQYEGQLVGEDGDISKEYYVLGIIGLDGGVYMLHYPLRQNPDTSPLF